MAAGVQSPTDGKRTEVIDLHSTASRHCTNGTAVGPCSSMDKVGGASLEREKLSFTSEDLQPSGIQLQIVLLVLLEMI